MDSVCGQLVGCMPNYYDRQAGGVKAECCEFYFRDHEAVGFL
jgi:hypothetical protein